ncbi:MAG: sensor histidine kinase, partial [Deltaproteobacteria bacterium]
LYLVLASLFILAYVVRDQQPAAERRLLDRSMLYSAIAALLSAGFLFGVLALMQHSGEPVTVEYGLSTFFLLAMAALAFEPLRQRLQERIGRTLIPSRAGAVDLARELVQQERRADHAERLAEIGALTSAVAHEVRNPLGVLQIHLSRLARQGADPETLAQMREQIRRAERFVEDLLRYGRPAALELREVRLDATIALAWSTARQGLGQAAPDPVDFECDAPEQPCIEADQAQLLQTFVVLFENALLALRECEVRRVRVHAGARGEHMEIRVEDSGPGIPEPIRGRIFEPFVTGRKREGPRPGTGLGLAIARRIVERHGGEIRASRSETLGGARFDLVLPLRQQILAAAAGAA